MAIQTQIAVFTGVEAYVDITWDTTYTNFALEYGLTTTDGSVPGIRLCNPSNPAILPVGSSVRVEPTALFSGAVAVTCIEVLP